MALPLPFHGGWGKPSPLNYMYIKSLTLVKLSGNNCIDPVMRRHLETMLIYQNSGSVEQHVPCNSQFGQKIKMSLAPIFFRALLGNAQTAFWWDMRHTFSVFSCRCFRITGWFQIQKFGSMKTDIHEMNHLSVQCVSAREQQIEVSCKHSDPLC